MNSRRERTASISIGVSMAQCTSTVPDLLSDFYICITNHLQPMSKSQLLFGWLRSTVPGLVHVGDGCARHQIEILWQGPVRCEVPQFAKNLAARLFQRGQLQRLARERVDVW